jgi:hypothetical protein
MSYVKIESLTQLSKWVKFVSTHIIVYVWLDTTWTQIITRTLNPIRSQPSFYEMSEKVESLYIQVFTFSSLFTMTLWENSWGPLGVGWQPSSNVGNLV